MKIQRKVVATALAALMSAGALTGCAGNTKAELPADGTPPPAITVEPSENNDLATIIENPPVEISVVNGAVDSRLYDFIAERSAGENYIFSPLSFKAALGLAVVGAEGQTQEQMLSVLGFSSLEELYAWYDTTREAVDKFYAAKERFQEYAEGGEDMELRIINSVWRNTDAIGEFRDTYIQSIDEKFAATAGEAPGEILAEKVNNWSSEQTDGKITNVVEDLTDVSAVLANAVFLRSAWQDAFDASETKEDDFTIIDGSVIQKEYLNKKDSFRFFENGENKLVAIPLNGGLSFIAVLGDVGNIKDALSMSNYDNVAVSIPKLDIESNFNRGELVDFMIENGAGVAFTDMADFSAMVRGGYWRLSDILQKARIETDEKGFEAAAVTIITMDEAAALEPEEIQYKEFNANRPFQFYVLTNGENPEILFAGACRR